MSSMAAVLFPDFEKWPAFDLGPTVDVRPDFDVRPNFDVRLGSGRPAHAVYVRRRLVVALVGLGLIIGIGASARSVLADRGGVPASTPAIRSATVDAASPPAAQSVDVAGVDDAGAAAAPAAGVSAMQYIVQPGDTLWSLAERFHGTHGMSSYVETLVEANGGASVQPGQLLTLP